jgi:hypothetical protein
MKLVEKIDKVRFEFHLKYEFDVYWNDMRQKSIILATYRVDPKY